MSCGEADLATKDHREHKGGGRGILTELTEWGRFRTGHRGTEGEVELARNEISRGTRGVPKCNLGTREFESCLGAGMVVGWHKGNEFELHSRMAKSEVAHPLPDFRPLVRNCRSNSVSAVTPVSSRIGQSVYRRINRHSNRIRAIQSRLWRDTVFSERNYLRNNRHGYEVVRRGNKGSSSL